MVKILNSAKILSDFAGIFVFEMGGTLMRKTVHSVIKNYLHEKIGQTRRQRHWPKRKMAEELSMDDRSYADIEKGASACSAVTFILFLLFVLNDEERGEFLYEFREEIRKHWEEVA